MKKLFTNDNFFGTVFLIAVLSLMGILALDAARKAGSFLDYDWFMTAILAACELAMFASYRFHNKNLMKGMLGATLMAVVMEGLYCATTAQAVGLVISAVAYTVLAVLIFATHFFLNADRHASPAAVKVNVVFFLLFAAAAVGRLVTGILADVPILDAVCYAVSSVCIMATVVCIEAKLDSFRLDREAAGWTEEAGYPEGYVHEYEKREEKAED